MKTPGMVPALAAQQEYLLPGRNALETSLELTETWLRKDRHSHMIETIKQVLTTLDANQVPYAVIGGLAVSHHAVPRVTQDIDLVIPAEKVGQLRQLFPNCYQRGPAVVEIYQIGDVRMDILPAKLRYQRAVVENAVDGNIQGTPAKVASVRDLILLKMFAAPNRSDLRSRKQDETDIAGLLEMNGQQLTSADFQYVGDRLVELCFTAEERGKTVAQIQWLNDTLGQVGLTDRAYPLSK